MSRSNKESWSADRELIRWSSPKINGYLGRELLPWLLDGDSGSSGLVPSVRLYRLSEAIQGDVVEFSDLRVIEKQTAV